MQNSIFLETLKGGKTSRPPVWFMRQAGRVLPSYLDLRTKFSFWQMMTDPVLAARITLMPVHELGVDAAILFSDILVIPYALGMDIDFTERGPIFYKPLTDYDNLLVKLNPHPDKIQFIYRAIDEIIKIRPDNIPLIGFAGAPLTVLCYMLEGLNSKIDFRNAIAFIYNNKNVTKKLIEAITDITIEYANNQIEHGIDSFQLFETLGGIIPFDIYKSMVFPSVKKISKAVRDKGIPFIYFPKDIGTGLRYITPDICDFVSVDWQTPVTEARKLVHPDVGLQGNLDPRFLLANKEVIVKELSTYLEFGKKEHKWIFNLGHGFIPGSQFESAKYIVEWVKTTNWNRS